VAPVEFLLAIKETIRPTPHLGPPCAALHSFDPGTDYKQCNRVPNFDFAEKQGSKTKLE
jgi:hypothetical protein